MEQNLGYLDTCPKMTLFRFRENDFVL